jgi:hypothetical protein
MKKSFYTLVLFCLIALTVGCNNTNPDSVSEFKYNITMTELSEPSWYDLVDSTSYITLKSPDGTVMGEIKQLIVNDDRIYVLADGFYCFDMEGNCLFKQTAKGRARNEFIDASSMSISDGLLFLYDRMQYKGLFFDAQTGQYISSVSSTVKGSAGYHLGDYIIINNFNDGDDHKFKILSKENPENVLTGFFAGKEHLSSIRGTISWVDDGLIYTSYRRNLAWKMTGSECIPYISITVPEDKKLPDQLIDDMIENGLISPKGNDGSDYTYGLSEIKECDGFITGKLNDEKTFIYFIFDKKSGNSRFFKYPAKEVWQQLPIDESVCAGYKDCICTVVNPENVLLLKSILGGIGNEPTQEKFRQAYDATNALTDNDYAIVARIWLKAL